MIILQLYGYELEVPRLGVILSGYMASGHLTVNPMLSYYMAATTFKHTDGQVTILALSGGSVISNTLHFNSPVIKLSVYL